MSGLNKILAVGVVAIVVGAGGYFLFGSKKPTADEVREAVATGLPDGASIVALEYEAFPADRSSGRVSVTGTYSLGDDLYTYPSPPNQLLASLASEGIFDQDLAAWWQDNSSLFPQFQGRLAESELIYSKGDMLGFEGELAYIATVDGVKVDPAGLDLQLVEGVREIQFGYVLDEQLISNLSSQIILWKDRQRAEQAAAEQRALEAARAQAAAEAEAREAERLLTELANDLPTSVVVPYCDDGWSDVVQIPGGWYMEWSWPGRSTEIEYLEDEEWERATTARIPGNIAALRFCTTSRRYAELRDMSLTWTPQ